MKFGGGLSEFLGIFIIALPFSVASLLLVLNSFFDQFFITLGGLYPTQAYSLCVPIYGIIVASGTVFGGVAGFFLKSRLVDGDIDGAQEITMQLIMVSLVYGLLLSVFVWVVVMPIYSMVAEPQVRYEINCYLQPIIMVFFGISLNGVLCGILNAIGLRKQYYSTLLMMTFTNILFDIVFVRILNMGTFGNGLGTAISLLSTGIWSAFWINHSESPVRISLRGFHWSKPLCSDIVRASNTPMLRVLIKNTSEFFIRLSLFLTYALSYGIPMMCSSFIVSLGMGSSVALAPRFAKLRAKSDREGAEHLLRISVFYGFLLLLALSIALGLLAQPIANIFCMHETLTDSHRTLVMVLQVLCLTAPFSGIHYICNAVFPKKLSLSYSTCAYAILQFIKVGIFVLAFMHSFKTLIIIMVIERAFMAVFSLSMAVREIHCNFAIQQ